MLASFERAIRYPVAVGKFISTERRSNIQVPFTTRLQLMRRGFLSQAAVLYDLEANDLDDYISDTMRRRIGRANSMGNRRAKYAAAMNNKVFFSALFHQYIRVPRCIAFIHRGRLRSLILDWATTLPDDLREVRRHIGTPLVFKPVAGATGKGVFFVDLADDGEQLLLDGEPASDESVRNNIRGLNEYVVTDYFHQGSFSSALYPGTTNTMRILTMVDPDQEQAFIPIAIYRIGTSRSKPVDNWTAGGLSAEINVETGELGRGAQRPHGRERLLWHENHPETGEPIAGRSVPNWSEIRSQLTSIADHLPFYRCIAWDIVLTDDGIAAIEANNTTDVDLLQIHRPLLRDERVRRFFNRY